MNKFLPTEEKFMPEIHLEQPGFTYSACGPFTKNKQKIQKFLQTSDTNYVYRNDLDKVCFQHEKGVTFVNAFQSILKESDRNPNKIWVDQGIEFYDNSFKKLLENNVIKMVSTYIEGKC